MNKPIADKQTELQTDLPDEMESAALFIKCLENEGVEYIFDIPGEENIAFMTDVYGRLSGRASVSLLPEQKLM